MICAHIRSEWSLPLPGSFLNASQTSGAPKKFRKSWKSGVADYFINLIMGTNRCLRLRSLILNWEVLEPTKYLINLILYKSDDGVIGTTTPPIKKLGIYGNGEIIHKSRRGCTRHGWLHAECASSGTEQPHWTKKASTGALRAPVGRGRRPRLCFLC